MSSKKYRFSSWLVTSLSAVAFASPVLTGCATQAPIVHPQEAAISPEPDPTLEQNTLSQSIQEGLTGLALETVADRDRIEREAKTLASARKSRGGSSTRKLRVQACQTDEPRDAIEAVFCRLWLEGSGVKPARAKRRVSLSRTDWGRKRLKELGRAIASGRVDQLAQATDDELAEALKKAPGSAHLRTLIENALDNRSCPSTTLLTGLGLRTEEDFPDSDYRELAEALYSRSAECGNDIPAAKGSYRLGLLQVWAEKYAEAGKTLDRLINNKAAEDYRSRVVYWRYYSAKQSGDVVMRDKMREILAKDYHLTLHGLITVGPKPTDNRPTVAFRSSLRPALNASVRVAEALLAEGATREAVSALEPILDDVGEAEPSFQLYVGLVLMRAGDSIRKFKVLSPLYRETPALLSRESLEMLFPLTRFEMIRSHERIADPFLMISLIRQESAFNDRARSPVGAMGLMQLMPRTARHMERVSRGSLFDPSINIRLGVRFFSGLRRRYNGEPELALAAYNAGPENVDTWKTRYPVSNRLLFVDLIPFRETREYVASIARNYFWYKKLYEAPVEREPSSEPEQRKFAFFKLFDS
jgi:soluble lytic murein transglycosylase